jgi:hypothetical protein
MAPLNIVFTIKSGSRQQISEQIYCIKFVEYAFYLFKRSMITQFQTFMQNSDAVLWVWRKLRSTNYNNNLIQQIDKLFGLITFYLELLESTSLENQLITQQTTINQLQLQLKTLQTQIQQLNQNNGVLRYEISILLQNSPQQLLFSSTVQSSGMLTIDNEMYKLFFR